MRGKKTTTAAFLAGALDAVVGSRERCSCQNIHMSSLFRHTLENVTSFQAWPGKGSTEEGGKAPDCWNQCQKSASHCVHACICVLMTHLTDGMCAFCVRVLQINDVGSGTSCTR